MNEFVWYDPQVNEFVILRFNMVQAVISSLKDNPPPGISKIEITNSFDNGRMIHVSGAVLEFIGEL